MCNLALNIELLVLRVKMTRLFKPDWKWLCVFWIWIGINGYSQKYFPIVNSIFYPDQLSEFQGRGTITQDTNGLIIVGFSHGIIEYDGRKQKFTNTDAAVLSLSTQQTNNITYVACINSFGYLKRNLTTGSFQYVLLSDALEEKVAPIGETASVLAIENKIYFYYPNRLYTYDITTQKTTTLDLTQGGDVSYGLARIGNSIYITFGGGLGFCQVKDGKIIKEHDDRSLDFNQIAFSIPYNKNQTLIGTRENQFYLSDGKKHIPFGLKAQALLQGSNVHCVGAAMANNKILLATRGRGCWVMSQDSGAIESILSVRYGGLPENDVNAIHADPQGRIWLAHNENISWTYLNLPINRYSEGLSGNINAIRYSDNLYVATDNGVYVYTRNKSSDDVDDGMLMSIVEQFKTAKSSAAAERQAAEIALQSQISTLQEQAQEMTNQVNSKISEINEQGEEKLDKIEQKSTEPGKLKRLFSNKEKLEKERQAAEERKRQKIEEERRKIEEERQKAAQQAQAKMDEVRRKEQEFEQKRQAAEAQRQQEIDAQNKITEIYNNIRARRSVTVQSLDF
jgi:hypothetical protein